MQISINISSGPQFSARRIKDWVFSLLCFMAALAGIGVLTLILYCLFDLGLPGISLALFTESTPPPSVEGGGLANAIVGTLIITGIAMAIAGPVGILIATMLVEFPGKGKLASLVRFFNDVLLSAPSILVGLFTYAFMVRTLGHFSGLAGSVALAFIAIPMVVRTAEGVLALLPVQVREAAVALGIPRWKVTVLIIWRAAGGGIVTALLLATARITGETAPLLFTALSNNFFTGNPMQPMANLPVVMFNYALSPYQNWQDLAWAGAILITVSILGLSVLARVFFKTR
jgi:phosphate transport system permease protein